MGNDQAEREVIGASSVFSPHERPIGLYTARTYDHSSAMEAADVQLTDIQQTAESVLFPADSLLSL